MPANKFKFEERQETYTAAKYTKKTDDIEIIDNSNVSINILNNNGDISNIQSKFKNLWTDGPDNLHPATSYIAVSLSDAVKLRLDEADSEYDNKPMSIYTAFKNTAERNPNHPALGFKKNDHWVTITFMEYWKTCLKAAKSFIKLGLDMNSSVAILGFNAPQWFISFLGAIFAGGIGCGIYTTTSQDGCEHIIRDSNSQIVIVENKTHLEKILPLRSKLNIKAIVQYSGEVTDSYDGLLKTWTEFIEYGIDVDDGELDYRIRTIAPNKCASLIYTSGTTGTPKAAMISHDNLMYLSKYLGLQVVKFKPFKERLVSYLPLSHIAAQVIDLHCSLVVGTTIYFAQPDALKGTLVSTMSEVKPTFFFGVPRVWEKMQERIEKIINEQRGVKLSIFEWSRKQAKLKINSSFKNENNKNVSYSLAKLLVLKKIKSALGLSECKHMYSGAAPIRKDTLDFFISLGLPLCEVFGMSESTGPHICGLRYNNRVASVGHTKNLKHLSKIIQPEPDGCGELCIHGRHVFMGYLNNLDKSEEIIDKDGWLHTGDLAKIDSDGYLYITGRLKEIIITAGGENIAPIPIEESIKMELPNLISQCMLIGDKRKYLTILVTLKSKINLDTLEPYDDLTNECIEWLREIGSSSTKVSEIINNHDEKVYEAIEKGIKRSNEKAISRAAKVQKFSILPRDFSLFNGELGPTLKLRRPIVLKLYSSLIDRMYDDSDTTDS